MQLSGDRRNILKYSNKMPAESDLMYQSIQENDGQLKSQLKDNYDTHYIRNEARTDGSNHLWASKVNQRQINQLGKKENTQSVIIYPSKQIVGIQKLNEDNHNYSISKGKDESFTSNNSKINIKIDSIDYHEETHHNEHSLQCRATGQLFVTFNNIKQKKSNSFEIRRQVAITYIAYADLPQEKYSRFRQIHYSNKPMVSVESIKSSMTDDHSEGIDQIKHPQIKLHQIQLFLHMSQVKEKRVQQLLHANEKLLLTEHYLQKLVGDLKKKLEGIQEVHSKQHLVLINNLKEKDGQIDKLKSELQSQIKHMTKLKNLNELYVKQNNDLKKKHRDNFKEVQLLKRDLHQTIKQNQSDKFIMQSKTNEKLIAANRQHMDYKHNLVHNFKNCRSQEILHQEYMLRDVGYPSPKFQSDLKSQNSYGKIQTNGQNINQSKRDKIEVGQINRITQEPLLMLKDKDDRSISSIGSCISGKSGSQKIGFIAKRKDRVYNEGMMVDLLVDNATIKAVKSFHQNNNNKELQRFRPFSKESID